MKQPNRLQPISYIKKGDVFNFFNNLFLIFYISFRQPKRVLHYTSIICKIMWVHVLFAAKVIFYV